MAAKILLPQTFLDVQVWFIFLDLLCIGDEKNRFNWLMLKGTNCFLIQKHLKPCSFHTEM